MIIINDYNPCPSLPTASKTRGSTLAKPMSPDFHGTAIRAISAESRDGIQLRHVLRSHCDANQVMCLSTHLAGCTHCQNQNIRKNPAAESWWKLEHYPQLTIDKVDCQDVYLRRKPFEWRISSLLCGLVQAPDRHRGSFTTNREGFPAPLQPGLDILCLSGWQRMRKSSFNGL